MFVKTFLTFLSVLAACTSTHHSAAVVSQDKKDPAMTKYEALAIERYKDRIDYVFNESKTHVLCVHSEKSSAEHPQKTISFFIYNLKNEKILYEESIGDGGVQWKNDRQVEITSKIGIISPNHESNVIRYLYDITSEKKTEEKVQDTKGQ